MIWLAKRSPLKLIATALVLVGLGTLGVFNPLDLVWVDRLLDHPFVLGVAAAFLCALGLAGLTNHFWVKLLVLIPGLGVAMVWALFGLFLNTIAGSPELARVSAPPGAGDDYEVVVREGYDIIDPIWKVSIRQTSGLLAREWPVGCISGDTGRYSLDHVAWDGRGTLVVATHRRTFEVEVNSATGRPRPATAAIWDSCV